MRMFCSWLTDHAIDHSSIVLNRLTIQLLFNEIWLFKGTRGFHVTVPKNYLNWFRGRDWMCTSLHRWCNQFYENMFKLMALEQSCINRIQSLYQKKSKPQQRYTDKVESICARFFHGRSVKKRTFQYETVQIVASTVSLLYVIIYDITDGQTET